MSKRETRRPFSGASFYLIILVAIVVIASFFMRTAPGANRYPYSEFIKQIENNNVETATISGMDLELRLKQPIPQTNIKVLTKTISPYWMSDLLTILRAAADEGTLTFDYIEPVNFGAWINGIFLIVMLAGMGFFIWFIFSRQNMEGRSALNFGRSRARLQDPSQNKVTFRDVAGADEEKAELMEVVDFLRNPKKYSALGARIPRGILLTGAPGTGKTLLARAVAGEAGVPFFSLSGSDFVEMFVGVGASRVRDMFETVKKKAPAIIFIDEIDAVGRQRGAGLGGGHDEREQTLNQLLVEMDGFGPNEDVIVMAATNRPDILDPALLRPGRFDRTIVVMRPDIAGREAILKVHARNKPISKDVDLKEIARITPGFTGADLANLLNEAALLTARRDGREIQYTDITEAVFKVMIGPEKKSRVISEKERRLTAWHEAGHAIILRTVSESDRVERVSIIPAGAAGGYTAHKPYEDTYIATRRMLLANIETALGGRAAEELYFDEISTGAASDLKECNSVARDMVVRYGMSERLGNLVFTSNEEVFLGRDFGHVKNYSDEVAGIIDEEVKRIIDEAYERVKTILRRKFKVLEALAETLLERERIEGDEFEIIYQLNTTAEERAEDAENVSVREVTAEVAGEVFKRRAAAQVQADDRNDELLPDPETE
ncbi:MAG: ATP-dependent metallopeptidase FtsH/Yme1/Tma family protein [Clostridiaceae bacterium]|nr:ATP-dependent metallopeptidase FtsH/Yme1/Tma family protein [Clostridiaceae bacterium]